MTRFLALIAALSAVMLPLDTASGSELSFDGRLVYTAAPGEANLAEFWSLDDLFGPPQIRVYDQVPIDLDPSTSSAGCARESGNVILCDPHPVLASLGDMDDEGTGSAGEDVLDGGEGDDSLWGGPGDDVISGGRGDDQLESERNLGLGPRDETLGADDLSGGPGSDALGYQSRLDGLTITLDDQANDGAQGEGDNVRRDIERVTGGHGNATLIGDDAANALDGFAGADRVIGGGGNDVLDGDTGSDEVRGEGGDDIVSGSSQGDVLDGGPGADEFVGDPSCTIFGCSGGDDVLYARDGQKDTLRCGIGLDKAIVDVEDFLHADVQEACEEIDRPHGSQPACCQVAPQQQQHLPTLRFQPRSRLRALLRGIALELTCPMACTVQARLRLSRRVARRYGIRTRSIATGHAALGAAGMLRLTLRPKRAARRRLSRVRRFRAELAVTVRYGGTTWTRQSRLDVRR